MEKEHAILVRSGHDTRTRVAISYRSMVTRRYSVIKFINIYCTPLLKICLLQTNVIKCLFSYLLASNCDLI